MTTSDDGPERDPRNSLNPSADGAQGANERAPIVDAGVHPRLRNRDLMWEWGRYERRFADQIGENLRYYRKERGLTAKRLSKALTEAGWPVTVDSVNGIFGKKGRESYSVTQILALARALEVPPIFLMLPLHDGNPVELSPGEFTPVYLAYTYLTASAEKQPLASPDHLGDYRFIPPLATEIQHLNQLHRHEWLVEEIVSATAWSISLREAERLGIKRHSDGRITIQDRDERARESLQSLSDLRHRMRAESRQPPQVPDALRFVDSDVLLQVEVPIAGLISEARFESQMKHLRKRGAE